MFEDRIAKQKLNVILLVDTSSSMRGRRIKQVNLAIEDIQKYLIQLQGENVNVDFYMSILTFGTTANWYNGIDGENVETMKFTPIKAGGYSNLHLAYNKLGNVLEKQSKGGMMPDFGGVAPIILLLTDGHPTSGPLKVELKKLQQKPWFKVALRYGVAIEMFDERTQKILKEFVGNNGEVVNCYDNDMLKRIIKVIVLTASKVKSQSAGIGTSQKQRNNAVTVDPLQEGQQEEPQNIVVNSIKQQIAYALEEVDNWDW